MKILVTGATGLVGSTTIPDLIRRGHHVITVSRDPAKTAQDAAYPATHKGWHELSEIFNDGVDAVVHLAGESIAAGLWTTTRKHQILTSRVQTTRKLVQACARSPKKPKVWINASAIGFYGDMGDQVVREESPRGAGFLADVCEAWEQELKGLSGDIRTVMLRIGVVLSSRGHSALVAMTRAFRLGLGSVIGNGRQWMSWIDVHDLSALICFALEQDKVSGPVNATAPEALTNKDFSQALANHLGKGLLPATPKLLVKALGEMAVLLLASTRVSSEKTQKLGFKFVYPTLSSSLSHHLDYQAQAGVFELLQEQWIPRKVDEIFPFFCDETNLERLTPAWLNFKVLGKSTPTIGPGTLIDYKLSLHGVPTRWQTEITEWKQGERFVDRQLRGPYKMWHHTHTFEPLGSGTLMTDRILYKLPLWPAGALGLWLVERDIQEIFGYRRKIIRELFT